MSYLTCEMYIYYDNILAIVMPTLKKIIFIVGTVTSGDDTKYMTVRDVCSYLEGEDNCYARVISQIDGHKNLFAIKWVGKRKHWRLNANGRHYLDRFINFYDPISDKMISQSENINQIFRPKRAEVI